MPRSISFETLAYFLNFRGVLPSIVNSIIVAVLTFVLTTVIGTPGGYALARYVFRGRDPFRVLILVSRAFPIAILAVPLAVTFINWNLYDTVVAVALVHTTLALPTTVLITSSIFLAVPTELEEAAWTLGCTALGALARGPPMSAGIAAASIFTFVLSWNEVFAATILTGAVEHAACAGPYVAQGVAVAIAVCRRLCADRAVGGLYLHHSPRSLRYVGARWSSGSTPRLRSGLKTVEDVQGRKIPAAMM